MNYIQIQFIGNQQKKLQPRFSLHISQKYQTLLCSNWLDESGPYTLAYEALNLIAAAYIYFLKHAWFKYTSADQNYP